MSKDTFRLLMLIGVIGFAVLYGMELSSSGINRVYGPLEDPVVIRPPATVSEDEEWTLPSRRPAPSVYAQEDPYYLPRSDREPLIDRLSSQTAETLHLISKGGIRFVVSLFDKVTGS